MLCRPLGLPSSVSWSRGWSCTATYHPWGWTSPFMCSHSWWTTRCLWRTRYSGRWHDYVITALGGRWGWGKNTWRGGWQQRERQRRMWQWRRKGRGRSRIGGLRRLSQWRSLRRRTTGKWLWTWCSRHSGKGSWWSRTCGRRWSWFPRGSRNNRALALWRWCGS